MTGVFKKQIRTITMKKLLPLISGFLIMTFFVAVEAQAIPAFARKYSQSCKTCHSPFPKLKPYGEEFAGDGFVIKDQATPRAQIETGDSLLTLLREVPLSILLEGFLSYNNNNTRQTDFGSPYLLKFLSGGKITKNISYFFYFIIERGEIVGFEDAFVMFNNLLGMDLDLFVGQFQVSDPLFKRELRLPLEDYLIYTATPGRSRVNLTYDRGLMLTYGFKSGTDLTVEILNGNGIEAANIFENFDDDKYKNFFFRINQDITSATRIGIFAYYGKEKPEQTLNKIWMVGADATFSLAAAEINLQYVERRDTNPHFAVILPFDKTQTRGAFGEIILRPKGDESRLYWAGLFNWVDSSQADLRQSTATLHCGYLLQRNIRLTAEATYVFRGPYGRHLRFSTGLLTAF